MSFTAKTQKTIHAPIATVWACITDPIWVKKYFFGTNLETTWKVGSPILFKGEWEGTSYTDKGTVLQFEKEKIAQYDYLSSWTDLPDLTENYQIVTYRVKRKGTATVLEISQNKIATLDKKVDSVKNWKMLLDAIKNLAEAQS